MTSNDVVVPMPTTRKEIEYHPKWRGYSNLPQVPGEKSWRDYWPRVSTLAELLTDKKNLIEWQCRKVVQGLHELPVLLDQIPVTPDGRLRDDPDSDAGKQQLNAVAETAKNIAGVHEGSDGGTQLHKLTEVFDLQGGTFTMDQITSCTPDELKTLDAYGRVMHGGDWEIVPEYIERTVVIPELECAGTLDRIIRNRKTGRLYIADLKTQKWEPGRFDGMKLAIQLGLYAHAAYILNQETWTWEPMPEVDQETGVIIWAPRVQPGRCELRFPDLAKGWTMARGAYRVKGWRNDTGVVRKRF